MSTEEILKEISRLPYNQKLLIIEKTKDSLKSKKKKILEKAASEFVKDYKTDKELTIFTEIDFENFYEAE